MGITKTDIFNKQQNEMAIIVKALAHPARIAILQHIIKSESCICNDLVSEIGLAQATISQHLRELKDVGIIKGSIDGTSVCYCIDEKMWNKIKKQFETFFNVNVNFTKCC